MTANKMPEMPEAVAYRHDIAWVDGLGAPTFSTKPPKPVNGPMAKCVVSETVSALYTADQMRAMYLAGLEATRACVPDAKPFTTDDAGAIEATCFNSCRTTTLANLTALEQEAKK